MVERITTSTRYNMLLADMQRNAYNYNKLTAQLSSGKKILNITDDPIASVNILNTNRQLEQIDTFNSNVSMASSELKALDDLMALSTGYLTTAWDKAVQANNQTYNGNSLRALKVEIDEISKTMVDLANTEYDNNYIFAGTNTKTIPFVMDDEGNIVYQGTPSSNPEHIRQTEVADGVFETINTTGDKIFGCYRAAVEAGQGVYTDTDGKRVMESVDEEGKKSYFYENGVEYKGDIADLTDGAPEVAEGVMGALRLLSNSLQMVLDGNREEGYALMNSTLDRFSNSMDTILNEQTKFGGVANRMEMTSSTLETTGDNLTSYLSQMQEIDYAEAITKWMNAQYAYQASLQVSASSMNMSLLNYL